MGVRGKFIQLFIPRDCPFFELSFTKSLEQFDVTFCFHCHGALALNQRLELFLLAADKRSTADYEAFELRQSQKIAAGRGGAAFSILPGFENLVLQVMRLVIELARLNEQLLKTRALHIGLLEAKLKNSLKPEFKRFHGIGIALKD
jgi:hypothetical protein